MKPVPIILKTFFQSTFKTEVMVNAIEDLSPVGAPLSKFKLTYDCHASFVYAFLTGGSLKFSITHSNVVYYFDVTAVGDCDFTIEGANGFLPVTTDTFRLPAPTFIHGTQKKAKVELDAMLKAGNVSYPLIYLQEIQSEKFLNDPQSVIYSKPQVKLWFLLPSKNDTITDNHYDNWINAMKVLADEVMRQLYYYIVTVERNEYDLVYHANMGTDSDTGHLKDLLNGNYSGVLMVSTLSLTKQICCC